MGDKSEAFARRAGDVLNNNPHVLPGNFDLAELRRDLAGFDQLRSRLMGVARIDDDGWPRHGHGWRNGRHDF
ncbi:hypothetical protein [Ralstonia mannitolilytica]|uniref:hypothetical protein n=1 Tax=Ralstonia mannitolilytica TaxID=105219 RepID=UPI00292E21CA|nr:hypothetical protein [Ralstonia mannitolilytica]